MHDQRWANGVYYKSGMCYCNNVVQIFPITNTKFYNMAASLSMITNENNMKNKTKENETNSFKQYNIYIFFL